MGSLLRAASHLGIFLRENGLPFCFIGGVAVQRWGDPRFTQDIDLTLLTGFGGEERVLDLLLKELLPRSDDARDFALRRRVLLAKTRTGISVDVALGALPFEERTIVRSTPWAVREGVLLTTCSAEDLVIHKVFAGRNLDWSDVERVLTRQYGKLDHRLIESELEPLLELKAQPESMARLRDLRESVRRRLEAGTD